MLEPLAAIELLLASASPRRKQLLNQMGLSPLVHPVYIDETPCSDESAESLVTRLARVKAMALSDELKAKPHLVSTSLPTIILAADTVIDFQEGVLGKPSHRDEGIAMLLRLSEREHAVRSGVCLMPVAFASPVMFSVVTQIRMGPISEQAAAAYWDSGEPIDKAGGYAIQGRGAQFVAHISGSYSNVVGLPLYETMQALSAIMSASQECV